MPLKGQEGMMAAEFYQVMNSDSNVVILDVRVHEKYVEDRIPDAVYAGEKSILMNEIKYLGKEQKILVYCDYGKRSKAVIEILESEGFKNTNHLENGYLMWKKEGFPVDETKLEKRDKNNRIKM
jgi:rhodanese-related sulfurtransferase